MFLPSPPAGLGSSGVGAPTSPSLSRQSILTTRLSRTQRAPPAASGTTVGALPAVQPAAPTTPPSSTRQASTAAAAASASSSVTVSMPPIQARTPSLTQTHAPPVVVQQTTPPSTSQQRLARSPQMSSISLSDSPSNRLHVTSASRHSHTVSITPPGSVGGAAAGVAGSGGGVGAFATFQVRTSPRSSPEPLRTSPRRGPLNNSALRRRRGDSVDINPVELACKMIVDNYRVLAAKQIAAIGVIEWSPDTNIKRIMSEFATLQSEVDKLRSENQRLKEQVAASSSGGSGHHLHPSSSSLSSSHHPIYGGHATTSFHDRAHGGGGSGSYLLTPGAMDVIDATASYAYGEDGRDLSPASRHSLRASRRSLGALPDGTMLSINNSASGAGGSGSGGGGGGGGGDSSSRRSTRGRGRGKKVALIIDSNTLSQRLTSVALHRAGFTACDLAGEGETAISMVQSTRYELILLDANLPTLSGVQTARAIRWMEDQRGDAPTMILIHTHSLDPASIDTYKSARLSGCLEKGCILAEAVQEASELLGRNSNFLSITCGGVKHQEARTNEQETEELRAAMTRGHSYSGNGGGGGGSYGGGGAFSFDGGGGTSLADRELKRRTQLPPTPVSTFSSASASGSYSAVSSAAVSGSSSFSASGGGGRTFDHAEGGAPAVRSNRRTTNTGRSMPLVRKLSSSSDGLPSSSGSSPTVVVSYLPSTTANSVGALSQSDAGFSSSTSSSPSPSAANQSPTTGGLQGGANAITFFAGLPPSVVPSTAAGGGGGGGGSATGATSRSVSPVPPGAAVMPPAGAQLTVAQRTKPRRASLSIHSVKDLAQRTHDARTNQPTAQQQSQSQL